jgi:hypothetical protein
VQWFPDIRVLHELLEAGDLLVSYWCPTPSRLGLATQNVTTHHSAPNWPDPDRPRRLKPARYLTHWPPYGSMRSVPDAHPNATHDFNTSRFSFTATRPTRGIIVIVRHAIAAAYLVSSLITLAAIAVWLKLWVSTLGEAYHTQASLLLVSPPVRGFLLLWLTVTGTLMFWLIRSSRPLSRGHTPLIISSALLIVLAIGAIFGVDAPLNHAANSAPTVPMSPPDEFHLRAGPLAGTLDPWDQSSMYRSTQDTFRNWLVGATFTNPSFPDIGWDYGFEFSDTSTRTIQVFITRSGRLIIRSVAGDDISDSIFTGRIAAIRSAPGAKNHLSIEVLNGEAVVLVNEHIAKTFDLTFPSPRRESHVTIRAGFSPDRQGPRWQVSYDEFAVRIRSDAVYQLPSFATVSAAADWQGVGITVKSGNKVALQYVSGYWSEVRNRGTWLGAEGSIYDFYGRYYIDNMIGNCNHAALIARIRGGSIHCIGSSRAFVADIDGEIELRINDKVVTDNTGWLSILVSVTG